jgi:hypothetical protein
MKKLCPNCKIEKDIIYFYQRKNGLSWCKECEKHYMKNWRIKNKEKNRKNIQKWYKNNPEKMFFNSYKNCAKKRNYSFSITWEQFIHLTQQPCHYCGIIDSRGCNGIDRKDNSIGYEIWNCVPCCTQCNSAKLDYTYTEFMQWIERVYKCQH